MTKALFYLLPSALPKERQIFACRLAEKAYRLGHKIYIRTESETASKEMDDLLWTFRAGSFVPHGILGAGDPDPLQPVLIGSRQAPPPWQEIIINLAHDRPEPLGQHGKVLEILNADPKIRDAGRARYKAYRELGYPLETHDLAKEGNS